LAILRLLVRLTRHAVFQAISFADSLSSTRKNQTLKSFSYAPMIHSKLFIYAIWTKNALPSESDKLILKSFKNHGFDVLVALNQNEGQPRLSHEQLRLIWGELCSTLIIRKNLGRDLAAYRDAFWFVETSLNKYRTVVCANNSVLWMPTKMNSFVQKVASNTNTIFSATYSYQPFPHPQTFLIGANGLGIHKLRENLGRIRNTKTRTAAVRMGELEIGRRLLKSTDKVTPLFSYEDGLKTAIASTSALQKSTFLFETRMVRTRNLIQSEADGNSHNPSHFYWLELYELGFPGFKKDLLSKNPAGMFDIPLISYLIEKDDAAAIPANFLLSSRGYRKKFGYLQTLAAKESSESNQ